MNDDNKRRKRRMLNRRMRKSTWGNAREVKRTRKKKNYRIGKKENKADEKKERR